MTEICYDGPPNTINHGTCRAGTKTCNANGAEFGPCVGQVLPAAELCETIEDEDCDGTGITGCVYLACGDVPRGLPTGVYSIDLDNDGPIEKTQVLCDMETDGGGWALVHNSFGTDAGTTLVFWGMLYDERFSVRGMPSIGENFYYGALYKFGKEYRDEIEDLDGKVKEVMRATADGIDPGSMRFTQPMRVGGSLEIFNFNFASGWSSADHDGDDSEGDCARAYNNVMQHYGDCWRYNLGADGDAPFEDSGWGPHINRNIANEFNFKSDGMGVGHTRVKRISRWTRW
ncbi:fibrinogen-like YCDxxxxGGGW domain-containing protein [Sorangium sp. So ce429]